MPFLFFITLILPTIAAEEVPATGPQFRRWERSTFHQEYIKLNREEPHFGLMAPYTRGASSVDDHAPTIRQIRAYAEEQHWEGFILPSRNHVGDQGVAIAYAAAHFLLTGIPFFLGEEHSVIRKKLITSAEELVRPAGGIEGEEKHRPLTPVERKVVHAVTIWAVIEEYKEGEPFSTKAYFAEKYPGFAENPTIKTRIIVADIVIFYLSDQSSLKPIREKLDTDEQLVSLIDEIHAPLHAALAALRINPLGSFLPPLYTGEEPMHTDRSIKLDAPHPQVEAVSINKNHWKPVLGTCALVGGAYLIWRFKDNLRGFFPKQSQG
jgi:hypothetical protein